MENLESVLPGFLLDKAQLVLLAFDLEGRLRLANAFARDLWGGDARKATFGEIFVDFNGALSLAELAAAPEGDHLLHLDCSPLPPQAFIFTVFPRDDEIILIGQHDYAETSNLRGQLFRLTSQMSNLNRELQKKNSELNRLNDLKNQFIGMAAHDMRNPLGQIMICCEFLMENEKQVLGEEDAQLLDIIRTTSRFMLGLIDDLLDLSAIEAGKLNLNLEPVDFPALLKRNVDLNSLLAAKRNIRIKLHGYQSAPEMMIDAAKMEQVLNNLFSNAIKYSPAGGEILAAFFVTDQDLIVSVADQGPGIPAEDIPKIFQPFSRATVAPVAEEKSTGLGLAISQRIILGHRGRLWVENRPAGGTIFFFSLPMEKGG
ncbi:MAG: HAMP domain-containing sensor histidine kinase [Pseudomonadota bacterium]